MNEGPNTSSGPTNERNDSRRGRSGGSGGRRSSRPGRGGGRGRRGGGGRSSTVIPSEGSSGNQQQQQNHNSTTSNSTNSTTTTTTPPEDSQQRNGEKRKNNHRSNNNANNNNGNNRSTNGGGRRGGAGGRNGGGRGRNNHRGRHNNNNNTNRVTTTNTTETPANTEWDISGASASLPIPSNSTTSPIATMGSPFSAPPPPPTLQLPTPPATTARPGKAGVPMILSRHSHPPEDPFESETQLLSERLAEAALLEDDEDEDDAPPPTPAVSTGVVEPTTTTTTVITTNDSPGMGMETVTEGTTEAAVAGETTTTTPPEAAAKPKKRKKKKKPPVGPPTPPPPEPASTTDALQALPAQEVSITARTQVKLQDKQHLAPEPKAVKKKKEPKKAARKFNQQIRQCVENGDPDTMRQILEDNRSQYALDASVLETVLKAYTVAAMFEDALFCLRYCTKPDTLSTLQLQRILECLPQNLRNTNNYVAADMIAALAVATAFSSANARTYCLRVVRNACFEFLQEAMSSRDRICSASADRLAAAGLCFRNVRLVRSRKDCLGVVMDNTAAPFLDSENRGIQAGDAVSILPYAGPYPMSAESLDRNMIEAVVTATTPQIILRLQDKMSAVVVDTLTDPAGVHRIDKLANRMGLNRQLAAAVAMASPEGFTAVMRPCLQLRQAVTAMDEAIQQQNVSLTSGLCGEAVNWMDDEDKSMGGEEAIRAHARNLLEETGALEELNYSQQLAVEGATTNRLTLVQGPPGTGKTRIAIRILEHWAKTSSKPILATSDSNIAVDNLVEGCATAGLRVVRLGRPEAIRPELLRYCIDRSDNNNPNRHKERVKQLKSGGDILDGLGPLERVLVDEATQATEAAVLVPLMRGCKQLVLVGDHCQLPPTVLSTRAEEEGHGVPLFSRMVACGVPPYMLDTQYRMHPAISMFPSDLFYGGLLKDGVSAPERRPLQGFPWPREEFPVAFIPVVGTEMDDGVSKYNEAEANAACEAVTMLLQGGQCSISDIAVVTPYAAQAKLIRRMTRRMTKSSGPPFIEVSSVDGFQGREKEAVVFSAVRSNDYGQIGFTSDWRRINVSFTRARRALIVIGNDQTLRRGDPDTWMPWLAWADAHGINMDRPGVGRGRYEPEQLRRVRGGTTAAEMLKDVLKRQQAQLKQAEKQQERAVNKSRGQIIGELGDDDEEEAPANTMTIEEQLKNFENADGNWDDSDDELDLKPLAHSTSRATLTSAASSNEPKAEVLDVWDL